MRNSRMYRIEFSCYENAYFIYVSDIVLSLRVCVVQVCIEQSFVVTRMRSARMYRTDFYRDDKPLSDIYVNYAFS